MTKLESIKNGRKTAYRFEMEQVELYLLQKFQLQSNKWHLQRGLNRLGFKHGKDLASLTLKLEDDGDGTVFPMPFTREDVKSSYKWIQRFCTNLVASLNERVQHERTWMALRALLQASIWRQPDVPTEQLEILASNCNGDVSSLSEEWIALKAKVALSSLNDEIIHVEFREEGAFARS